MRKSGLVANQLAELAMRQTMEAVKYFFFQQNYLQQFSFNNSLDQIK
jgi:hypothetical protein